MRSILDGHIVLNRELAARAIYPPIDVLASASRVMMDVTDKGQQQFASRFKELLASHKQAEDLINIGAYKPGSNPTIDYAISKMEGMMGYIRQGVHDGVTMEQAVRGLGDIFDEGMAL
jgi:flagellum-specific ATP synthase